MFSAFCLKKTFIALSLTFALCIPSLAHAQTTMRIAAVVNDDIISAHDLAQRIRLTIITARLPDTAQNRRRLAPSILKTMVDERLKVQQAEKDGIEVSEQQIDNGLAGYARSQKIPPNKLDTFLKQIGVEREVLAEQARAEISWASTLVRNAGDRIKVTENEVTNALEELNANKGKPEYKYAEIYLPVETPTEDNAAKDMANRLIGHIKAGASFAALARDFSQSPSAVKGGELGWVQSGTIDPTIEKTLAQLPLGGYSNPIRTAAGYHLLNLQDKRIAGQEEEDEILNIAQVILPIQKTPEGENRDIKRVQARSIATQANSCESLIETGQNAEGANAGKLDNLKFSQMPPMIRQSLATVTKGQIVIQEDPKGAILVLMVCDRQKVAPMPEVAKRKEIRQRLRMEKIAREEIRQLQQLRRSAFVDIRL